jgi:hypothetical protein
MPNVPTFRILRDGRANEIPMVRMEARKLSQQITSHIVGVHYV